ISLAIRLNSCQKIGEIRFLIRGVGGSYSCQVGIEEFSNPLGKLMLGRLDPNRARPENNAFIARLLSAIRQPPVRGEPTVNLRAASVQPATLVLSDRKEYPSRAVENLGHAGLPSLLKDGAAPSKFALVPDKLF